MSRGPATAGADSLARAWTAARACGVTRLGDLTRLDRIGTPVFTAVRPWSRALSVQQGKGFTPLQAQVSALMEAVESAHAEAFSGPILRAAWSDLPAGERAPCVGDYGVGRDLAPAANEAVDWVAARRILDASRLWVPFDAVSLDFSRPAHARISRSSNGQAAHFDREAAVLAAVFELIERDAVAAWFETGPDERMRTQIEDGGVRCAASRGLMDAVRAAGLWVSLYELASVTGHPVILAALDDPQRDGPPIYGTGCAATPEVALEKALLEAVQSRLTEISGARDDIIDRPTGRGLGLAAPAPFHVRLVEWDDVGAGPAAATSTDLARALAAQGYPDAAVVDLSPPASDVVAVKAFAPGLGAFGRSRRPPLQASR